MGHHNFYENDHHQQRPGGYNGYYGPQGHGDHNRWIMLLDRLRGNRSLKMVIIIAAIIIISIIILLIVLLFPLIVKLFNYIMQNGLQGIWDSITGFADKLLKGTK
jgi:hypothetical protein